MNKFIARVTPTSTVSPSGSSPYGLVSFESINSTHTTISWDLDGFAHDFVGALHVHQHGDLLGPDGTSTAGFASGAHYNPFNVAHGCYPDPREAGDLIYNLTSASGSVVRDGFDMTGDRSILGRTVLIHQMVDDCVTPVTGNAGARLSHGVIGTHAQHTGLGNTMTLDTCQSVVARIAATNSVESAVFAGVTTYGTVSFIQSECDRPDSNNGIYMRVCLSGLTPGAKLGLHIHQFGDWTTTDAISAGPHWNPGNRQHGLPSGAEFHAGDLGNIDVDSFGMVSQFLSLPLAPDFFTPENLLGLGIVLHAAADDGVSQPTGNSGARLGFGVIGVGSSTGLSSAYNTCGAAAPIVPTETVTTETAATETPTSDDPSGLSGGLTWVWALVGTLAAVGALFACFNSAPKKAGSVHTNPNSLLAADDETYARMT